MATDILLEQQGTISNGVLSVQVEQKIEINVSADEAQRRVSVFVLIEIGNLVHGEKPLLVLPQAQDTGISEGAVWRVPVHLTRPSFGDLGQVGHIDVNVTSGELMITSDTISSIKHNAENLVNRLAPQTATPVS